MSLVGIVGLAVVAGTAGVIGAAWLWAIASGARRELAVRNEHRRADRAHYAAIEAAEDDPSFAPDAIEERIAQLVSIAERLWRAQVVVGLDGRVDAPLITAWARARQSWLGSRVRVRGKPVVDLLRVVNRADESEDRVVVRVRVRVRRYRSPLDLLAVRHVRLDERWTLGRYDGQWALLSVEGDPMSGPVLTAPLIPTPAHDTERLREASFAELGTAQKIPDGVSPGELVGADEPPAFALLDLSVVDGRFLPELVAAQLAHVVEAWEEAVTGSAAPLEAVADTGAATALLHPAAGRRLVIRDAVLTSWEPLRLQLSEQPPTITAQVVVNACRYVVSDDGTHRAGNDDEPREIPLTWTLQLTEGEHLPWRLVASSNPADGIPGWKL